MPLYCNSVSIKIILEILLFVTFTSPIKPPVIKLLKINTDDSLKTIYDGSGRVRLKSLTLSKINETDIIGEYLLICNATYPVEWVYNGQGFPTGRTSSQRYIDMKKLNESKSYKFSSTLRMIGQEGNTGNYTCQSIGTKLNPKVHLYIFVPGGRVFLLDYCDSFRHLALDDVLRDNVSFDSITKFCNQRNYMIPITINVDTDNSWVRLPCAVSDPKSQVILYQVNTSEYWTHLKPNASLLTFDVTIGYDLKYTKLTEPFSSYFICASNTVNTLINITLDSNNESSPLTESQFPCSKMSSYSELVQVRKIPCNSVMNCRILKSRLENLYYLTGTSNASLIENLKTHILVSSYENATYVENTEASPVLVFCFTGRRSIKAILMYRYSTEVLTQWISNEGEQSLSPPILRDNMLNKVLNVKVLTDEFNFNFNYSIPSPTFYCEGPTLFFSENFIWKVETNDSVLYFQGEIYNKLQTTIRSVLHQNNSFENLNSVTCYAPVWYSSNEWAIKTWTLKDHVELISRLSLEIVEHSYGTVHRQKYMTILCYIPLHILVTITFKL